MLDRNYEFIIYIININYKYIKLLLFNVRHI